MKFAIVQDKKKVIEMCRKKGIKQDEGCLFKKYVDVVVLWNSNDEYIPLFLLIEGQKFKIDKILDKRQLASAVGGCGIRYQCRIGMRVVNLFFEQVTNTWFIESMKP